MSVSTHVLDAGRGLPASGVDVRLAATADPAGFVPVDAVTDGDGRIGRFGEGALPAGDYRLTFATGAWFAAQDRDTFYPEVSITFRYSGSGHVHVPILLSPFSYTTYRGS